MGMYQTCLVCGFSDGKCALGMMVWGLRRRANGTRQSSSTSRITKGGLRLNPWLWLLNPTKDSFISDPAQPLAPVAWIRAPALIRVPASLLSLHYPQHYPQRVPPSAAIMSNDDSRVSPLVLAAAPPQHKILAVLGRCQLSGRKHSYNIVVGGTQKQHIGLLLNLVRKRTPLCLDLTLIASRHFCS